MFICCCDVRNVWAFVVGALVSQGGYESVYHKNEFVRHASSVKESTTGRVVNVLFKRIKKIRYFDDSKTDVIRSHANLNMLWFMD